jgi:hypothetical protein
MTVLSPLIGFLGSRTKLRIYEAYGVNPVAATSRSLFLEYLIIIMALAWTSIFMMVAARGYGWPLPVRPAVVIVLFLLPDALMRWDRLLAEDAAPPGFYEWLFRSRTRAP